MKAIIVCVYVAISAAFLAGCVELDTSTVTSDICTQEDIDNNTCHDGGTGMSPDSAATDAADARLQEVAPTAEPVAYFIRCYAERGVWTCYTRITIRAWTGNPDQPGLNFDCSVQVIIFGTVPVLIGTNCSWCPGIAGEPCTPA